MCYTYISWGWKTQLVIAKLIIILIYVMRSTALLALSMSITKISTAEKLRITVLLLLIPISSMLFRSYHKNHKNLLTDNPARNHENPQRFNVFNVIYYTQLLGDKNHKSPLFSTITFLYLDRRNLKATIEKWFGLCFAHWSHIATWQGRQ